LESHIRKKEKEEKMIKYIISLLMLVAFASSEAKAEDTWKLANYRSFTFNPANGKLSIYGKASGTYVIKLEVVEERQAKTCTIRVLIIHGTTSLHKLHNDTSWEVEIDLETYVPPYTDYILEKIKNEGFRPEPPPPMNLLKKYKGVDIEGLRRVGKKLKRSIIRIDFSQMAKEKE
jgi:hypothetical protein